MSKSTSKKEAHLKASLEELIEPLLKRISGSKCGPENYKTVERLSRLVRATKGLIEERQRSKCELITCFGKMEREIDLWECEGIDNYLNDREDTWGVLMDNLEALLAKQGVDLNLQATVNGSHDHDSRKMGTRFEFGESSNSGFRVGTSISRYREFISRMVRENERVVFFLAIFPQNVSLKRRQLINWWEGLSFRFEHLNMDQLFSSLIHKKILAPVLVKKHNQVTHLCKINRTFHQLLHKLPFLDVKLYTIGYSKISCAKYNINVCSSWQRTAVLNQDQQYLNSLDLIKLLKSVNNNADINYDDSVQVVQLGKWGGTGTGIDLKSKDHIEVDDTHFLNYLAKSTTYLGLQGISRIEKLPESIGNLPNLRILDLRACHNLEKLPEKPQSKRGQVTWFSKLVYLDVSECYLLDYMPKWISELHCLKVLKGFVAGNVNKKEQSCQLHDLVKLHSLQKLSIRIAKHLILHPVDASALKSMTLSILTVTWGIKHNNEIERDNTISFPETLEKLDLRCYPKAEATELNPAALPNLKRLYIRGGELTKIETGSPWKRLKVLRLRYLNDLVMDWSELSAKFTSLNYVEYEHCPLLKDFPEIGLLRTRRTDTE